MNEDRHARLRWSHRSPGAEQKTDADLAFKRMDPLCDRCWRQIEPTGGLSERALLDHGNEAFEKPCIHRKQKLSSEVTIINILFCIGKAHRGRTSGP